jgi:hypothetical protein
MLEARQHEQHHNAGSNHPGLAESMVAGHLLDRLDHPSLSKEGTTILSSTSSYTCPLRLFPLLKIEHPIDAEPIGERSKSCAPERILERHRDLSFFAERGK